MSLSLKFDSPAGEALHPQNARPGFVREELQQGPRLWSVAIPTGLVIAGIAAIWFLANRYDSEPYVPVLAMLLFVGAMIVVRRLTGLLVAALMYVGNFKTKAAIGVSVADPTFIVLMLCCAGLFLECLWIFSKRGESILALFRGQGRAVLFYLLFLLMILVSMSYTVAPESGLEKLERMAVFGTLVFFAPFILFKRPKDLNQFLVACILLSLALSLRNLIELFHPVASVLSGNTDITRIGDAELIGATLVILIYHRFSEKRPGLRLAAIALLAVGLVASAARSAAFSVLIVIAITAVMNRSRRSPAIARRALLSVVLATIIAGVAMFWIRQLPAAQAKLAYKADELSQLVKGSFLPGGTAEQRMNFYQQSLVAIGEKPLLGWGVSGWGVFFLGADQRAIPHNFILEAAVEQGLIGCGLLLGFLITTSSALRKVMRHGGPYFAFLLPVFLLSVLLNLVTGDLESRMIWFWSGTILAVARMLQYQTFNSQELLSPQRYRTNA